MYNLKSGINSAVDKFQGGKENEALKLMPLIIDGMQWTAQAVVLTKDLYKKEIELDEFNQKLKEVAEAIENEDYILVGDLFEYEVIPILDDIHEIVKESV
ncbi:hypothetical protein D4Z93_09260 [Clostridium fermenticellae]|uniref:DUF8042 domain-containing protein n=2 Tax=Clostridium fermenticellae TaxID=2068654 RepID=A0A386H7D0_9CLOT|nr:hypothetical protein D4Z93_09260 [Clostridium fermenticellae]